MKEDEEEVSKYIRKVRKVKKSPVSVEDEVARLRAKMNKAKPMAYTAPELPDMEKTEGNNEADVQRLKEKSEDSAVGVVKKVMKEPEVQKVLKSNINKQTFISGLFMAFLLIGFLEVSTAVKEIINYTWQFDLIAGLVLIIIGAAYMVKEIVLVEDKT